MLVLLHSVPIALSSRNTRVTEQWRTLFDYELDQQTLATQIANPAIWIEAEVLSDLPELPPGVPLYTTHTPPLAVYAVNDNELILRLVNQVHMTLQLGVGSLDKPRQQPDVQIYITSRTLEDGSFEDVTTLALAPMLRRRGFYMVHAFSAAHDNQAVMFVGKSGSGKTSSGMALISQGWHFLANDVALLRENGKLLALLSPGTVNISAPTFSLLPEMELLAKEHPCHPRHGKVAVPRRRLLRPENTQESALLKIVYFPQVTNSEKHALETLPQAVGLARMMESSMDQWDQETWNMHLGFLERLSHQICFRSLYLGRDLSTLPDLLNNDLGNN